MMDIQNYPGFVAAVLVFQAVPGPGTLSILNATARGGVAAGFGAVAGTLLGDLIFMLAAIAGLAAVMNTHPGVFKLLQLVGAAYLIWIGVQLLKPSRPRNTAAAPLPPSPWMACRRAFLVGMTNPKAILFFMAFFPLFLKPQAPTSTLFFLVLHVSALCLIYQVGLVLAGNAVARRLRSAPLISIMVARLAGLAMIGFGIKLALAQR